MKFYITECVNYTWWQNFWHEDPEFYSELAMLQLALAPYNCRYVNEMWPETPYIEFDTEHDYVMFVLRWS